MRMIALALTKRRKARLAGTNEAASKTDRTSESNMGRDDFIQKLEEVSANIESVPLNEVATLLRRAAIRLRNLPPPMTYGEAEMELQSIMNSMNQPD